MKKTTFSLVLTIILVLVFVGTALAANPNPGVVPNKDAVYGNLSAQWWQWAYSFQAANVPFLNTGGAVNVSAGQSGDVWFLAGEGWGIGPVTRTGVIPAGKQLFFPMANLINDYPCPDPNFQPPAGQSLESWLQQGGVDYLNSVITDPNTQLFAVIDGKPLTSLADYQATSSLFTFKADPALASTVDACITGSLQPGVSVGYWLYIKPLTPGKHVLHFGAPVYGQDITYILTVKPGR